MTINTIGCLTQVANFLKVHPGKINLNSNSLPVRVANNSTTTGFIAIIFDLLNHSNLSLGNLQDKAEIRQWLEYALVYAINCEGSSGIQQVLKELNAVLSTRTYLVTSNVSIADVVLFYILYHIIANLSYLDKERYIHVSRWYDNLQQDANLRQKNKIIDFNTNYLICVKH
ncbi:hypothetical protein ILUMI_03100 [Ignelater luminosus]|uniref:GST C-terminal domain-containing protein n=1 Tax=Ignelater luminosus TaxID=2038154 RepID=A0A8K0DC71_IGNLU|nr:hypothetical protein ILUMI_03100 [Ignelater luminosus]